MWKIAVRLSVGSLCLLATGLHFNGLWRPWLVHSHYDCWMTGFACTIESVGILKDVYGLHHAAARTRLDPLLCRDRVTHRPRLSLYPKFSFSRRAVSFSEGLWPMKHKTHHIPTNRKVCFKSSLMICDMAGLILWDRALCSASRLMSLVWELAHVDWEWLQPETETWTSPACGCLVGIPQEHALGHVIRLCVYTATLCGFKKVAVF